MKTIFASCTPREEVQSGELREDLFAARLHDVMEGSADPIYQDPKRFFANTYPTSGLERLLREALGRLTGAEPSNAPIIRLETSFGGGKTHNLIALYHLAASGAALGKAVEHIVAPHFLPGQPVEAIAGVVGTDLDVANGINHGAITTYTPWGEIAYQLKGNAGYSLLEESDQTRVAPGTQVWERMLGEEPALIMLDELARYLRTARGFEDETRVGETSLAQQTVAFLMSLMEFAASRSNVVLVYTLTEASDAFGEETETINRELEEARSASARQEQGIIPAKDTEIASIVTHRLFHTTDRDAAEEVASQYVDCYRQIADAGLPVKATRAEYGEEIQRSYPFHPELLTTLTRKTATIPNFQRTRGALRLLASAVRKLWQEQPEETYLIHPHHMDLRVERIAHDLTSRLERPRYRAVIEADIYNASEASRAHAAEIDEAFTSSGRPPYATRVATTIFLNSLTHEIASGIEEDALRLSVVQPGDDPALIKRAIDELENVGWFLEYDGRRYRFKTEPALNKIIEDEVMSLGRVRAKKLLNDVIEEIWPSGILQVVHFPQEAAEVPDDSSRPHLAVIHYDATAISADAEGPPEVVRRIFNHAGAAGSFRRFKNHLLFLVADKDRRERMVDLAQKYLAIQIIKEDRDRMGELAEEQQDRLQTMYEQSGLNMRVAITKCYRFLYYPDAGAPEGYDNLKRETLPGQEQGEVVDDQCQVVLAILKRLSKVLDSEEDPLNAQFVRAKAWPQNRGSLSTEDLRKAFAQKEGLQIILDINQLKATIANGIQTGTWVYYDEDKELAYDAESPSSPPPVKFSATTVLYTPEEAENQDLPLEREEAEAVEQCLDCGRPLEECICGVGEGEDSTYDSPPVPTPGWEPLEAEGVPNQAFQAIVDLCHDQGIEQLTKLSIAVEGGSGDAVEDTRKLGLVIPQLDPDRVSIEQEMVAEFEGDETLEVSFRGSWNRYQRLKQLTDAFGREASDVNVQMVLTLSYPDGLGVGGDAFRTVRETMTDMELGAIQVEAVRMEDEADA